jgi:hypothetical protein
MDVSGVFADVFLNLHDQLARRRHDQSPQAAPAHPRATCGQPLEDRQNERGRLAGPGLRDPNDVVSAQDGWNRFGLNGGRLGVTGLPYSFSDVRP